MPESIPRNQPFSSPKSVKSKSCSTNPLEITTSPTHTPLPNVARYASIDNHRGLILQRHCLGTHSRIDFPTPLRALLHGSSLIKIHPGLWCGFLPRTFALSIHLPSISIAPTGGVFIILLFPLSFESVVTDHRNHTA